MSVKLNIQGTDHLETSLQTLFQACWHAHSYQKKPSIKYDVEPTFGQLSLF
jgi:hypothetical protein